MATVITEKPRTPLEYEKADDGKVNVRGNREFEVSGVASRAEAIAAVQSGGLDADYDNIHPDDSTNSAAAFAISANPLVTGYYYAVTVGYSSANSDAVFDRPYDIEEIPYTYTVESDRDLDGIPYVNTTGLPFDHGFPQEKNGLYLNISRWESVYPLAKHFQYAGKVNTGTFTWPTNSCAEGQAKFLGIVKGERSANSARVRVTYKFDIKEDKYDHQHNVIDASAVGWTNNPSGDRVTGLFVGGTDGEPMGQVFLDGDGSPLVDNVKVAPYKLAPSAPQPPNVYSPSHDLVNTDLSTDTHTVLTFRRAISISFAAIFS